MATTSPCIGLCRIDPASNWCTGCARSGDEIAIWKDASPAAVERIWAELPGRRAELGIGLHRLGWSTADVAAFVLETLHARRGSWVVGPCGAGARFAVGPDEACEVARDDALITARTDRGAIRFAITGRARALAVRVGAGAAARDLTVLAVPRDRSQPRPNTALTAAGADHAAIRPADRDQLLYDLGVGSEAAAFCLRAAPGRGEAFDRRLGQGWAGMLAAGDGVMTLGPVAGVVLSPLARVEVFAPVARRDDPATDGPAVHLDPALLALARETPPGLDVPESFVPCAIFDPGASRIPAAP